MFTKTRLLNAIIRNTLSGTYVWRAESADRFVTVVDGKLIAVSWVEITVGDTGLFGYTDVRYDYTFSPHLYVLKHLIRQRCENYPHVKAKERDAEQKRKTTARAAVERSAK